MQVVLDSLDLAQAERKLCAHALSHAGTIVEAASLLGITRHALKRRITKHQIAWPPPELPKVSNAAAMHEHREYQARMSAQHQDPRMNRAPMRPASPGMGTGMHTPNPSMPQHGYDHRTPMENTRVRPTPPHQHGLPSMMNRPNLGKYDR